MQTLEALYLDYRTSIFNFLSRKCQNRDLAEDLTQETFLRAARNLKGGTVVDNPKSWLYRIAKNLFVDWLRYRDRYGEEESVEELVDTDWISLKKLGPHLVESDEPMVRRVEVDEAVRALPLHQLTPYQQNLVYLNFLLGYSTAEIARLYGKEEGAIKSLKIRAIRKLRMAA